MKKQAYIIVSNSISEVLTNCIELIDDAQNDIYILFDRKAHLLNQVSKLKEHLVYSKISFCEQIVNWGGYSQISAVMQLLKMCIESKENYEYIHYFQGSDLPIKNNTSIRSFLKKNIGKEFVSIELNRKYMAENKCHYYHFFCHNRYFRYNKVIKALNFGLVYIQKIFHIKINTDIDVFQGSALFSITSDFAKYLMEHEMEIKRRFRYSLAADACFIQTMIMNSPFKERIYINANGDYSNIRLIDRTRPDGKNSPHIWRDDEIEYVLSKEEDICFARKFDMKVAPKIVDEIKNFIKRR